MFAVVRRELQRASALLATANQSAADGVVKMTKCDVGPGWQTAIEPAEQDFFTAYSHYVEISVPHADATELSCASQLQ